ncbi:hypothetical protein B0I35DRAFT_425100 [Stachybotrys elegans]|uniref:Xylanolytic transcriptional activator regulatory domain-containing protein n=1 Tax=Stachybotrys elegans TaxID=80388 RepID=A0A8K0WVW1_9HYPO|nr:hypothetical protein B0I35DRAFT_425100 [Stachybotrys elegans]
MLDSPPPTTEPPRACLPCNNRKVRCDKAEPVRRTRRAIFSDMTKRIASLEKSLAQAKTPTGDPEPARTPQSTVSIASPSLGHAPTSTTPTPLGGGDVLLRHGASTQYINESFVAGVIDNDHGVQTAISSTQDKSQQWNSPYSALGIFSAPNPSQPPHSLHPPPEIAHRLWGIYKTNIGICLSSSVLHLPTDEIKVYSTIRNPEAASYDNLALCFSTYFVAVMSCDESDVQGIFGQDKNAALWTMKLGVEQSLAHGCFLDSPTLTSLNAFSIYMAGLRVFNQGKAIWILNGVAIRVAQSLGVHRDGERLGLSPFQAELNRRQWWQLIGREARAGEDYGLQSGKGCSVGLFDVAMPLNVDDCDLYPEMTQLPAPSKRWTPMTFSLVKSELYIAQRKLIAIASTADPSEGPSESSRLEIINDAKARVEELLSGCNEVIPQHLMTIICARHVYHKLDFVTRKEWHAARPNQKHEDFATDEHLLEAIDILEMSRLRKDKMLLKINWATNAYPQHHITMYILWHLCVKPEGPHVERAWTVVEAELKSQLGNGRLAPGSSYEATIIPILKAKAEARRVRARNAGLPATPDSNDHSTEEVEIPNLTDNFASLINGDSTFLGLDMEGWPAVSQGFQHDGGLQSGFWIR